MKQLVAFIALIACVAFGQTQLPKTSVLPGQYMIPVDAAGGGGGPFTPLSLTGMVFWVDAHLNVTNTAGTSPPSNGDKISMWGDQSTNSWNFTNVNWGNVIYDADGSPTNGPAITFTDSSAALDSGAGFHNPQPHTFFFVAKAPNVGGATTVVFFSTNLSYRTDCRFVYSASHVHQSMYAGTEVVSGASEENFNWIWTYQFNGASSILRTNGAQSVTGNAGSQACAGLRLGNIAVGQTTFLSSGMSEGLMYEGAMSADDMLLVEKYLAAKHGITNSVVP